MPRAMPALASQFRTDVDNALGIAEAGEIIRAATNARSIPHRQLSLSRLEALHEMAYLRIFVRWEHFLESSFLRMMCGYQSPLYTPSFPAGTTRRPTIDAARTALFAGRDYLLWYQPKAITKRCEACLVAPPHEAVVLSAYSRLEWFAWVRHRIAHGSEDAQRKLNSATMGLAGRRYRGSSAGRFLRDWDPTVSPSRRWLHSIGDELVSLASQIAP